MLASYHNLQHKPRIRITNLPFLRFASLGTGVTDVLYGFDAESAEQAKEQLSADFFVFPDRPWLRERIELPLNDEIMMAVLSISSYDDWFSTVKKQTRNMIRKSLKDGIMTQRIEELSGAEAKGILGLFKETPFREGRYFGGYHIWNTEKISREFVTNDRIVTVLAKIENTIVGVSRMIFNETSAVMQTLLTSTRIRGSIKGVANCLVSAQVQEAFQRDIRHLIYGKLGILPGLDIFRMNNGFAPSKVRYNYMPLTKKAEMFAKIGIYRPRDLLFSTKLRGMASSVESLQKYIPIKIIQKFHLYA